MSAKNEHGLTPQQEKFCQEVVKGSSLAEAYRVAYPRSQKWADSAVWSQSSQLRADGKVSQRVALLAQKVEEKFTIDTSQLLREAHRLANSNVANIMWPDGKVKLPHELDPDTAAAVASFKIDEYGRIEYKFWDKNSAQERLFKHKGLFEVDNKQKADPLVDVLKALGGNILGPGRGVLPLPPEDLDD